MRVIFQMGIWLIATFGNFEVPSPNDWGWENNNGHCRPRWITQKIAACQSMAAQDASVINLDYHILIFANVDARNRCLFFIKTYRTYFIS